EELLREEVCERLVPLVPHEAVARRGAVGEVETHEAAAVESEALRAVGVDERPAVLDEHRPRRLRVALGEFEEGPVVEDVAVLVNLDEGGAPVGVRAAEHGLHVLRVAVEGAGDEGGVGAEGDGGGVEGVVERAVGRAPRHLPLLARRAVLPLGEAVDLVVEEDELAVEVAAEQVEQVVAADGERVAVAGDDPDVELGPARLEAGRHRRRAAVDGVEAVRVHVVGEPARAADAGDEHDVLPPLRQLGEDALDGGQHGVVPAPRAPADVGAGDEVLAGEGGQRAHVAVAHRRRLALGGDADDAGRRRPGRAGARACGGLRRPGRGLWAGGLRGLRRARRLGAGRTGGLCSLREAHGLDAAGAGGLGGRGWPGGPGALRLLGLLLGGVLLVRVPRGGHGRKRRRGRGGAACRAPTSGVRYSAAAWRAASISLALKGRPWILVRLRAGIRNRSRRRRTSWPSLSSGTSTVRKRPMTSP